MTEFRNETAPDAPVPYTLTPAAVQAINPYGLTPRAEAKLADFARVQYEPTADDLGLEPEAGQ